MEYKSKTNQWVDEKALTVKEESFKNLPLRPPERYLNFTIAN